jgi:hypothetical protein
MELGSPGTGATSIRLAGQKIQQPAPVLSRMNSKAGAGVFYRALPRPFFPPSKSTGPAGPSGENRSVTLSHELMNAILYESRGIL